MSTVMIAILICSACCVFSSLSISPFLPILLPVLGLAGLTGFLASGCVMGPGGWGKCKPGEYCSGIKCVPSPGTSNPGDSCTTDKDCRSGKCYIGGVNKCANDAGKLVTGTYCLLGTSCTSACASGSGHFDASKGYAMCN